jgi:hypothetical protein
MNKFPHLLFQGYFLISKIHLFYLILLNFKKNLNYLNKFVKIKFLLPLI